MDRPLVGRPPAVALINPKYPHNVGAALRACSCWGIGQLWWTGRRVTLDVPRCQRLPREERMKGYRDVELVHFEHPLDQFPAGAVPVAVEVRPGSEPLHTFDHPADAVYVFGPEDGSLPKPVVVRCHRFVVIPTRHCLNLATAVATVLWDREYKRWLAGTGDAPTTPGAFEHRGLSEAPNDLVVSTR